MGPLLVRVAAWPVETLDGLRSPQLAARVDRWIEREEATRAAGHAFADRLHDLVPQLRDVRGRRAVLALRRCLHNSTAPLPERPLTEALEAAEVPGPVKAALREAEAARQGLRGERLRLTEAYDAARARERAQLFRIVAEPAFLKALYLSSPATFAGWERFRAGSSRARSRPLEATLFAYVMRAVGRATPSGLWAGVGLEDDPADTRSDEAGVDAGDGPPEPAVRFLWTRPLARFSPNLAPFAAALGALGRRDPWRRPTPFRLNPTLRLVVPQTWRFAVRAPDGAIAQYETIDPRLARVVDVFARRPLLSLEELVRALAARAPEMSDAERTAWLQALVDADVLRPALGFPPLYASAWEALDGALTRLVGAERAVWEEAIALLRRICRTLEGDPSRLSIDELREADGEARAAVRRVLDQAGLPPVPADVQVLLADLRAPVRFRGAAGLRDRIEAALREYWAFDRYGLGEIETAVAARRMLADLATGQEMSSPNVVVRDDARHDSVTGGTAAWRHPDEHGTQAAPWIEDVWETLLEDASDPELRARLDGALRRWRRELEPVHAEASHVLTTDTVSSGHAPLPSGTALFLLGREEEGSFLRLGGVAPDPCLLYARFHALFGNATAGGDVFARWYRGGVDDVEAACPGLRFIGVGIRGETPNYNAMVRPPLMLRTVDPLGIEGDPLPESRIRVASGGRPVWTVPGDGAVLVPRVHSAAALDGADPVSRTLAAVGQLVGRPALMQPLRLFQAELCSWHHLPRLALKSGVVIGPERWVTPRAVADALVDSSGVERFIAWRRFVCQARLPELVQARYGAHWTETLVPTDSVHAVEHLARGLTRGRAGLRLQAVFPSPDRWWLRDAAGQRYLAEFVVAWHGDIEFWRQYRAQGLCGPSPAASGPGVDQERGCARA